MVSGNPCYRHRDLLSCVKMEQAVRNVGGGGQPPREQGSRGPRRGPLAPSRHCSLGVLLVSAGTRRAPATGWWQDSRAATSSPCWIGSGSFTVAATARDARTPAGEAAGPAGSRGRGAAGEKLRRGAGLGGTHAARTPSHTWKNSCACVAFSAPRMAFGEGAASPS